MSASLETGLRWLRTHGDSVFAAVFAVAWLTGVVSGGIPTQRRDLTVFAVVGLLLTVPFGWRRRAPVLMALFVYPAGLAYVVLLPGGLPIGFLVATLVAAYSLGAHAGGRRSWFTLVGVVIVLAITNSFHNDSGVAGLVLTPASFGLLPWGVGRLVARLRTERRALSRLTLALEAEQQEVARASVMEERSRIARELHDIVAHSLSVMVVQAGAAEQFIEATSRARQPLEAIRTTGQEALVEMRRLLGILRADDAAASIRAPQPGLSGLDALVEAARRSGLAVEVAVSGEPVPLAPGVDVAAYRLVQESFSNVRKHARAHAASVTLRYEPRCLTIDVCDDGIGARDGRGADGHGVIGMRERVSIFGGQFECGPRREGGWRVRAQLPLAA